MEAGRAVASKAVLQARDQVCLDQAGSIGERDSEFIFRNKWAGIFSVIEIKMRERKESKGTPGFWDLTCRQTIIPFTKKEKIESTGFGSRRNQNLFFTILRL